MFNSSPDVRRDDFLKLTEEVHRIATSLVQLSTSLPNGLGEETLEEDDGIQISKEAVEWVIAMRRARSKYLSGDLFAEPAWDLMLDLLRAEIVGTRVSVSSACIAARVPATTALRRLSILAEQGVIIRKRHPSNRTVILVELSRGASQTLRRYFRDIVESQFRPSDRRMATAKPLP